MTIEAATYISDLNASLPAAGDDVSEGDDHLRLIKAAAKTTFPNVTGAVTPTHTELNYVGGVTSAIQTQLDARVATASLGAGVATFIATPSSANLAAAVTGETGTGALVFGTAPAITNPTITNFVETVYAPAAGTAFTVDLANGTYQKFTSNGNITITLPSAAAGKSYLIEIAYGGTHTLTWAGGTSIVWAGGSAPTATSVNGKRDKFAFTCPTTSTTDGVSAGANF